MNNRRLPPGQHESDQFPRFGPPPFAYRFPKEVAAVQIRVSGSVELPITVSNLRDQLPHIEQVSDFHCVTTWSRLSLAWSGFRFADFYECILKPQSRPQTEAKHILLRSQDGYRTSLPLEDLLHHDVLLADQLDGNPLSIEHGAPLRLVAPAHYGYKSIKHLNQVEFLLNDQEFKPAGFRFMYHPRARVANEERGIGIPGWILRYVYRPLIQPNSWFFQRAMASFYEQRKSHH